MKKIPLTRGQFALVDDEDYDVINRHKWHATKSTGKTITKWYAHRQVRHSTELNSKGEKKQVLLAMHRVIMNAPNRKHVDHIDGNPLNNQKSNLRLCTPQQNVWNRAWKKSARVPYKGVTKYECKKNPGWLCHISVCDETINLGWFKNPIPAARAYDKLAKVIFGEFAWLNFPVDHKQSKKSYQ